MEKFSKMDYLKFLTEIKKLKSDSEIYNFVEKRLKELDSNSKVEELSAFKLGKNKGQIFSGWINPKAPSFHHCWLILFI